ncbi:hypothetical protein B0H11DRAFT_1932660 [Mycena galericulata]|nr:hypothetical protein B0H11DRAFT_1932660 [Mycena galericulata]
MPVGGVEPLVPGKWFYEDNNARGRNRTFTPLSLLEMINTFMIGGQHAKKKKTRSSLIHGEYPREESNLQCLYSNSNTAKNNLSYIRPCRLKLLSTPSGHPTTSHSPTAASTPSWRSRAGNVSPPLPLRAARPRTFLEHETREYAPSAEQIEQEEIFMREILEAERARVQRVEAESGRFEAEVGVASHGRARMPLPRPPYTGRGVLYGGVTDTDTGTAYAYAYGEPARVVRVPVRVVRDGGGMETTQAVCSLAMGSINFGTVGSRRTQM